MGGALTARAPSPADTKLVRLPGRTKRPRPGWARSGAELGRQVAEAVGHRVDRGVVLGLGRVVGPPFGGPADEGGLVALDDAAVPVEHRAADTGGSALSFPRSEIANLKPRRRA